MCVIGDILQILHVRSSRRNSTIRRNTKYKKMTSKAWNWYQRWPWRNATRTSGKTGEAFQMFRCSRKCSTGTTQIVWNVIRLHPITRGVSLPYTPCGLGGGDIHVHVWHFRLQPKKLCFIYFPTGFFRKFLWMANNFCFMSQKELLGVTQKGSLLRSCSLWCHKTSRGERRVTTQRLSV